MKNGFAATVGASLSLLLSTISPAVAIDILDTKCREFRGMSVLRRAVERPEAPYCATNFTPFDEYSFETCKFEIQEYRRKVEAYADCLAAENDRAVEEFNEAVQNFNRRASQ